MLQQNFSTPHITNVMENVAYFLQVPMAMSALGDDYLCRKQYFSIPPITLTASSKSVHRLSNKWDMKSLFVMTFMSFSHFLIALIAINENKGPNCPVGHLSDLLISVSFKIR